MNATTFFRPAWPARWAAARQLRLQGRQGALALYERERRPGLPAHVANAHARFEHAAREAMREWLML